jgi:arylsulfatase
MTQMSARTPGVLYNLADDPGEQRDVAPENPERLQALIAEWDRYALETGVVLPDYNAGPAMRR